MIDVAAAMVAELALKSAVLPIAALLLVRGLARRRAGTATDSAAERAENRHDEAQSRVSRAGRRKDLEIIESSNPVFSEPALWVAKQFRYAPRIVGGSPVAVEGVRNRIAFRPPQQH